LTNTKRKQHWGVGFKMRKSISIAIDIITIIFVVSIIFGIGWFANEIYRYDKETRKVDGLWIKNVNESRANDIANDRDDKGEWICVNIRGMEYSRAVEVCQHEVGHEIFAEVCEKNMTKCESIF